MMATQIFLFTDVIFPFLGYKIAPDIASLAEVSTNFSNYCRLIYCKHCGQMFQSYELRNRINGRSSHIETCEWLKELDPFRFFYNEIPWKSAFVAGGWAAWLHFHEHRNYINPWKKNGPLSVMDLDVFFYNTDSQVLFIYSRLVFRGSGDRFETITVTKSPSVYLAGRYTTETDASAQITLSPKSKPNHQMKIDLIGANIWSNDPMKILDDFDQPCCRVGFSMDKNNNINWILHPTHIYQIKHPKSNNTRELLRRTKYINRGYLCLKCNCVENYIPSKRKKPCLIVK